MFANADIVVTDDLSDYLARLVTQELEAASALRRYSSVVLAGGTTFQEAYRRLAVSPIDWSRVQVFFGDERQVGLDDRLSNYRAAAEALSAVWEKRNVHPLEDSAAYDVLLRGYLDRNGQVDVTLLGLGKDGHTASLFPAERERWEHSPLLAIDTPAGLEPMVSRRTLTPRALNASRLAVVMVTGEEKADIVARVANDEEARYPVSVINPLGRKLLLLDPAASGLIM